MNIANRPVEISIIIPFYNEEEMIVSLCEALNLFFIEFELFTEIIFVNDGSVDDSVQILRKIKHEHYAGKIVSLSKNFGSHAAIRAGLKNASGQYVCFMNADLQDPLCLIPELYKKIKERNEIVWGFRNNTQNCFSEKLFSKLYSTMMRKYAISNYPEKGYDIVMFSRKVLDNLNSNIESNSSIHLQILTLGFKQTSVGYDKSERKKGESKWTFSKKAKLFIDSFVSFSYAPIRFVTLIGIIMFIVGMSYSTYLIIRKSFYDDLLLGWSMLISVLTIGFGITNISLGIIAEYLWRTLDSSRNRPVFIIDEVVDLNSKDE